ncbi:MAG: LysR family transcriptional regulator [Chloroflexi bacterium]|nr:LysR family transcriptional regulator [Chloroflexota bacterium]
MDLVQLRAFVQTARLGSFSAAAQALGTTQPAVSRQIKQLERELGFELIDREQRPVALTLAGREFVSCAETVVSQLETVVERLAARSNDLKGSILVAASTIPGEFLVPGLLAQFTALHPQVRPSLVITDSAGVAEELLSQRAEVGFLGAPLAYPRLCLTPFTEDDLVLIVPAEHPFAQKGTIGLADLAGQPFVEREGGSGTLESLKRLLAQQGMRLPEHRVAMVAGTSQTLLAAIGAGVGIGFVSSLALDSRTRSKVAVVEIDGIKLKRTLYLAHEHGHLSAIAQAFVKFVMELRAGQ